MSDSSARPVDSKTPRVLLRAIPLSLSSAIVALLLFGWLAEEVLEPGTTRFDDSVRALALEEVLLPAVLIFLTSFCPKQAL